MGAGLVRAAAAAAFHGQGVGGDGLGDLFIGGRQGDGAFRHGDGQGVHRGIGEGDALGLPGLEPHPSFSRVGLHGYFRSSLIFAAAAAVCHSEGELLHGSLGHRDGGLAGLGQIQRGGSHHGEGFRRLIRGHGEKAGIADGGAILAALHRPGDGLGGAVLAGDRSGKLLRAALLHAGRSRRHRNILHSGFRGRLFLAEIVLVLVHGALQAGLGGGEIHSVHAFQRQHVLRKGDAILQHGGLLLHGLGLVQQVLKIVDFVLRMIDFAGGDGHLIRPRDLLAAGHGNHAQIVGGAVLQAGDGQLVGIVLAGKPHILMGVDARHSAVLNLIGVVASERCKLDLGALMEGGGAVGFENGGGSVDVGQLCLVHCPHREIVAGEGEVVRAHAHLSGGIAVVGDDAHQLVVHVNGEGIVHHGHPQLVSHARLIVKGDGLEPVPAVVAVADHHAPDSAEHAKTHIVALIAVGVLRGGIGGAEHEAAVLIIDCIAASEGTLHGVVRPALLAGHHLDVFAGADVHFPVFVGDHVTLAKRRPDAGGGVAEVVCKAGKAVFKHLPFRLGHFADCEIVAGEGEFIRAHAHLPLGKAVVGDDAHQLVVHVNGEGIVHHGHPQLVSHARLIVKGDGLEPVPAVVAVADHHAPDSAEHAKTHIVALIAVGVLRGGIGGAEHEAAVLIIDCIAASEGTLHGVVRPALLAGHHLDVFAGADVHFPVFVGDHVTLAKRRPDAGGGVAEVVCKAGKAVFKHLPFRLGHFSDGEIVAGEGVIIRAKTHLAALIFYRGRDQAAHLHIVDKDGELIAHCHDLEIAGLILFDIGRDFASHLVPAAVGVADDDRAFLHADVIAVIGVGAAGRGVGCANHHAAVPAAFAGIEGGLHGVVLPVLAAGNHLDVLAVADVHLVAGIGHHAVAKNDPAIIAGRGVAEIVGKVAGDAPRVSDVALLGQGLHGKFLRLGEDAVDAHLHLSIVGGVRLQAGEIRDPLVVPLRGHGVAASFGAIVDRIEAVGAVDVGGELDGVRGSARAGHLGFIEGACGNNLNLFDGHACIAGEANPVIVLIAEAESRIRHQILQVLHGHRGLTGGEGELLGILGVDIEGQFTRTGISHHHPVGIGVGDNHVVKLHGLFALIGIGLRRGGLAGHRILGHADPGNLIDVHAGAARGDQLNLRLQ